MRKIGYALLLVFLFGLFMVALAGTVSVVTTTSGYGGNPVVNVTTNPVDVRFTANIRIFSVYNGGASTQVLYVLPNTTLNNFLTAVSVTSAVPVVGGNSFDFIGRYDATNIVVAARAGDGPISIVTVAGYQ